jgi:N-acetylglucosaminyl-diphospho-decaprenol L-rhamnosyltransferase
MRLAVLIVSYNTAAATACCVRSLLRAGGLAEIVVVDNASTDDSLAQLTALQPVAAAAGLSLVVLCSRQNCGFSRAVNRAARQASAPGLLLLNSDTELGEGAGAALAAALDAAPEQAAVSCRQVDATGYFQLAVGPPLTYWGEGLRRMVQRRLDRRSAAMASLLDRWLHRPCQVPWAAASVLAVRRTAFFELGGFDARFFLFFEDIDFCLRLRRAGGQVIYDPRISVLHHRGLSCRTEPARAAAAYRASQAYVWQKHVGRLYARPMCAWANWRARVAAPRAAP